MLLLGAVLAGGRAPRFGGDKAMVRLRRKALIDHAIDTLRPQVHQVVICGRNYPPYRSLPDRPRMELGPLGGLCAALHHAAETGYDGVLAVGCDTPYFPHDLADRLAGPTPAVLAGAPIIGFWPTALAPALERHLEQESDRSVVHWVRTARARLELLDVTLPDITATMNEHALRAEVEWENQMWLSVVIDHGADEQS